MNFFRQKRSNQYILFFWISFSIVLFLNVLVWMYLERVEKEFRQELRERLIDINQVLSRLIVETNDNMDLSLIVPGNRQSIQYLYYRQLLDDIRLSSKLQSVLLVSTDGKIIVASPEQLSRQIISSLSQSEDFRQAASGKFIVSQINQFAGEKFISAYAPIRNLEGFIPAVLIIEAKAGFFKILSNLKERLLLFSFINLFMIVLIAFLLFRMIRKSIAYQAEIKNKEHLVQLGTMAATVAHELRNPLSIIEASNDVIRKKYTKEKDEIFSYIPQEIKRLNVLIDNFLKFARTPQLEISPLIVSDLTKRLQMSSAPVDWERCALSYPPELKQINTDVNLVEQVLLNIFSNALQATSANGKILIKFSVRKNNLIIAVQDNGVGIQADQIGKIFEPFFSTKEKGTGLGLAISKRLVENLQGKITLKSTYGKGTTVTVVLPDLKGR